MEDDNGTDPKTSEDLESIEGMEVMSLKIEFDLVPEWSDVVEKIARFHSRSVAVGYQGQDLVVRVAIPPERKLHLVADLGRYWDQLVERRKREGRWYR